MNYPSILESYREKVEDALKGALAGCRGPHHLIEAMAYSLFAGGKRIRPVLLLSTSDVFPSSHLDPFPTACALEFIHTYSLIHDDLPAMDNDDYRRGQPTNHKKFGEALAILAGDALLTEAFGLMTRSYRGSESTAAVEVIAEVDSAAGSAGMVGGQVLDTIETGCQIDMDELKTIHRMKTGALIVAAVRCGAILGGAKQEDLEALTRYAERIGLAFQVADDLLDVVGTQEELGKSPGKDQAQNKTTFSSMLGVDRGKNFARTLVTEAQADLDRFGQTADALRAMAQFIVERTS